MGLVSDMAKGITRRTMQSKVERAERCSEIATSVDEFMHYLEMDDTVMIRRMIKNVFGSMDNLSMSFQLRGMGDIQMTQTAFGESVLLTC